METIVKLYSLMNWPERIVLTIGAVFVPINIGLVVLFAKIGNGWMLLPILSGLLILVGLFGTYLKYKDNLDV